jgi:hypothetical protein
MQPLGLGPPTVLFREKSTLMHGIFISAPYEALYFVAERAGRALGGQYRFRWSSMPGKPTAAAKRIDPAYVPYHICRKAYRHLAKRAA